MSIVYVLCQLMEEMEIMNEQLNPDLPFQEEDPAQGKPKAPEEMSGNATVPQRCSFASARLDR